jgi:hypothetical protein
MAAQVESPTAMLTENPVVAWRFSALTQAGYGEKDALSLALRGDVDLHVACDLLRRDCTTELALRILT